MLTFKCFQKMTKRDLVVASTRHHLARLLKYYPRRPCAPSLIKSRFFSHTTNLLTVLTFLHFEIPFMYTRGESQGASSGFPCGGNHTFFGLLIAAVIITIPFLRIIQLLHVYEFLVSKETVVLRRWERSKQKFGFINLFDETKFLYCMFMSGIFIFLF